MSENSGYSDIDGLSAAKAECVYCGLNVHEGFIVGKLCKNCRRLFTLYQLNKTFQSFFLPAVLLGVILYFVPVTHSISYWIPVIAVAPAFIMNSFQKQLIFYGQNGENRILPMLRYYKKLNDQTYADKALEFWLNNYESVPEPLRLRIFKEFVNSVILSIKPNPPNVFEKWAEPTGQSLPDFIEFLVENTTIMDAFKQIPGTGTLPDIWEHSSNAIRELILDQLIEDLDGEAYAEEEEKKLLLEDLYLVEDELKEFIGDTKKWQIILDELDAFEPEVPPKNVFQEARRTAEAQSKIQKLNG